MFVVALGDLAIQFSSLSKGTRIAVDGTLRQETWKTKDKSVHHRTVILADELTVLEAHEPCRMRQRP